MVFLSKSLIFIIFIQAEKRLFTKFHRQIFCWMDKWHGLTMDDIRKIEEDTLKELEEVIIFKSCGFRQQFLYGT